MKSQYPDIPKSPNNLPQDLIELMESPEENLCVFQIEAYPSEESLDEIETRDGN